MSVAAVKLLLEGSGAVHHTNVGITTPPPTHSLAATSFIARTSGLDATHTNAYYDLLDGLTTDGLFNSDGTSSYFDCLYIFSTDQTTAKLNLVSSSFPCVENGSPTFTVDYGYAGVEGSITVFLDTGFDPSVAGSPKFTQNSAHVSVWSNTSAADAGNGFAIGLYVGGGDATQIVPRHSDGNVYFRCTGTNTAGISNSDGKGHYVSNRNSSTTQQGYKNAVDQGVVATNSTGVGSGSIVILAVRGNGTPALGYAGTLRSASIGASLTSTQVTNFYNRLTAYFTAIGAP